MIILVWYGMAWHGMVWHGMARGAARGSHRARGSQRLVPYHAIPCHAIPYHTSIIIFAYYCIFILLYIIILLYYYISDIAYCSLFVVHAPIQHLGHLKDLIFEQLNFLRIKFLITLNGWRVRRHCRCFGSLSDASPKGGGALPFHRHCVFPLYQSTCMVGSWWLDWPSICCRATIF